MAFTETAPQFFASFADHPVATALRPVGGVTSFELSGVGGGHFLVNLSTGAVAAPGSKLDLIVRAQAADLMALVEGRMSAADGLTTQRLRMSGDAARVARFLDALTRYADALRPG